MIDVNYPVLARPAIFFLIQLYEEATFEFSLIRTIKFKSMHL